MANTPLPEPEVPSADNAQAAQRESQLDFQRYKDLVSRVVDAFGDEVKASRWLSQGNLELGGRSPLEAVQSDGYRMELLEPILIRLEHGVYY